MLSVKTNACSKIASRERSTAGPHRPAQTTISQVIITTWAEIRGAVFVATLRVQQQPELNPKEQEEAQGMAGKFAAGRRQKKQPVDPKSE